MIDLKKKNSAIMFLFGMILLGILNILTYPYLPFNGILLTVLFLALSFVAAAFVYRDNSLSAFYWVLFSVFNLTVFVSRVFVNTTGIGTPKSTGSIGPFTVEQLWIGGLHMHHYWLGFMLLPIGVYMLRKQVSKIKAAAVLGAGLALVFDELGIILAGHTYHSNLSYISLAAANTFLLGLLVRDEDLSIL